CDRRQMRRARAVSLRTGRHGHRYLPRPRGAGKILGDGMPDGSVKPALDYHALNAMLNLYDEDGRIRFDADRMAARQYFLQHVNQNTVFFHSLDEKLGYLVDEGYYEAAVLDQYSRNFQRRIWEEAYARKFRFPTFLGAFKYYTSYTL